MSGHSKWHSIRHQKAINDSKKANIFTRLLKEISVAARAGGDPESNFRLRLAIERAKNANTPKENIERAIKRGTGELKDSAQIEEVVYEAYGPGQIAMLIKVATDNKNRTLSEIKNLLKKNNGKFSEGGGVAWQFSAVGIIRVSISGKSEEEIEMKIIESGANDYQKEEKGKYEIYTATADLKIVKENLEKMGFEIEEASLGYLAKNKIVVDEANLEAYQKLWETLNDHDDVSQIFDNVA